MTVQIILIHGLSIPSLIYASVAPSLAQQGFRVLLYDLYGRGYSDAVEGKGEYDTTLYTTQLALLMQRVGWDKAGVVGVSMVSSLPFSRFCCSYPLFLCLSTCHHALSARLQHRYYHPDDPMILIVQPSCACS